MDGDTIQSWRDWSGAIASILGLVMTVVVMLGVGSIRKHFLFRARSADLVDQVSKLASAFASGLQHATVAQGHQELVVIAGQIAALMKSLKKKVPRQTVSSIKEAKKVRFVTKICGWV